MPHLHDEDSNADDTSQSAASCEAVCPAAESAANKLLSLAAMAEEHGKSSAAELPTKKTTDSAAEAAELAQKEDAEPPQLVEGHTPPHALARQVGRHPPPYALEDSQGRLLPPSPGMGPRWGGPLGHHPRFHGFVRPMHRVYPGGPMGGAAAGSPVAEHPVRYMHGPPSARGGRGGFPMWTAASPRPPYRPPPSPLPPAFRSPVQQTYMSRQFSQTSNDDDCSVSSGRGGPGPKRPAVGYPTKSILKKPRVDTPTTASSSDASSTPSAGEATKEADQSNYATLATTVSASFSTVGNSDNADDAQPTSKTSVESVVVEKASFSSEDGVPKKQRIISPASSNEYQKSDHDEEYVYTHEGSLSPETRHRIMSHEAAAAAAAVGSPGPHYRLAPPFRMGRHLPPVQGMHCGPPRRSYMPPGPMYVHHPGMRPFPPLAVAGHPPGMYPPRNMSSRGRPGFAGMPPFYARGRMEASPSPSSVTPEQQPRQPKHVLDSKPPQPPVSASPVPSIIQRRQSGTPVSAGGVEAIGGEIPGSANRCIPLTPPVPSKYWSDADIAKDIILPDFHRLVNFPDLLVKGRNVAGDGGDGSSPNALSGKKRCVMCGQLRVSATYVRAKNKGGVEESGEGSNGASNNNANGSSHIIPRQNKGVCTACDVTVWVALELDGMEIKWCKGCKNFRPWSHFGDKSLATKCLRCRDRQKEKYAMQKSASRRRSSASSVSSVEEKKTDDHHPCSLAVVAANGLRELMNAATR